MWGSRAAPRPDVGIEIDISRSSLNRWGVYAALRVPEVWRFGGTTLHVYHLGDDGEYALADYSRLFPFLPMAEVAGWLLRRREMDENSLVREFRAWVRGLIAQAGSAG